LIQETMEIRIEKVRPNSRLIYEESIIHELSEDIQARGLLEPITVELVEIWFCIIDGEKRWRACKKIGRPTITAIIILE